MVYNAEFYYTAEELEAHGVHIDVETVIEQPELHIVARSRSSDAEQSVYSLDRLECIKQLSQLLEGPNGRICHVLHFFHGANQPSNLKQETTEVGTIHV